jgi:uncharacterized membrane protein
MLLFVVSLFPFSTNLYYNTNEFENTARGFFFFLLRGLELSVGCCFRGLLFASSVLSSTGYICFFDERSYIGS